jgi:acetyl esterase/lipase
MNVATSIVIATLILTVFTSTPSFAAESVKVIDLWPGTAPGDTGAIGEENDVTKPSDNLVVGKPVIRLGNVSKPTIAIYRPPSDKDTGSAVLVCPGGGYNILAMDLEGTEVCAWLNSIGVTGVLLKYRVPKRAGLPPHAAPLQDAQRALGMIRHRAKDFGLDPNRLGVLGFSAGGHLAAALSNNYQQRNYAKVDDADETSCRPDFALLIYPAYLTLAKENDKLAPEMTVTTNTPPTFVVMAADDPVRVENALCYSLALKKEKVPVELHVYSKGGHGYGLRLNKELPVTSWPERATDWLRVRGLLQGKS